MVEYTKEQRERLKELISKRKWNFVLFKGVLYWGGIMCILFILMSWFVMGEFFDSFVIWFNVILWGIGGLIFGLWTWDRINKNLKNGGKD